MRSLHFESDRIYVELVSALFTGVVPLLIMSLTYLLVGGYIYTLVSTPVVSAALILGVLALCGKAYLHIRFPRSVGRARLPLDEARRWDRWFSSAHLAFASCLGSLLSATFASSDMAAHLLATGMLFGFCAGQVARVAVRKRLCMISIFVATVPCVVVAAANGDAAHLILAGMFALFAIGSTESVRFAYRQTHDRLTTNHDLEGVASLDPLTGLLNRLGLRRAVEERWSQTWSNHLVAVHCLDLDGFKMLNDQHGHAAGDATLRELAERVTSCLSAGDFAVRLGGDEFAIIQAVLTHIGEADLFARRINRSVTAPYGDTGTLQVGVSIGTCIGHVRRDSFSDMLAVADQRMYDIKRIGGGIYNPEKAFIQR